MRLIADLHIHSRYSRATSSEMSPEITAIWARKKGISLIGTGDFTHPVYFSELKAKLIPAGNGLFKLKKGEQGVYFMLTAEVSNIFTESGKVRKIHTCIFSPGFEEAKKIIMVLSRMGNITSDGRPIFGFYVKELVKNIFDISPDNVIVPAHAWTPWFSLFGANSGFDSVEECFGDQSKHIFALETGLSSDPEMNWRLSSLDRYTLISNSDAHSPGKLGREANIFDCKPDYKEIMDSLRKKDPKRFINTIEFFPEEGKYHYDGHRSCNLVLSPQETKKNKGMCPVCGKKITVGVMHRVDDLADRPPGYVPANAIPTRHLIPLEEIIADALGVRGGTKGVAEEYDRIIEAGGSEFSVLLDLPYEDISNFAQPRVVEGIRRVREGRVKIAPGYDGVYGRIEIFGGKDQEESSESKSARQMSLF